MSSFSKWLWIFCSLFGSPMTIKRILPKITDIDVKLKENQNWLFFGDFVLIAMGKPNMLQKIQNYLEKADNVFFLHIVVYFL